MTLPTVKISALVQIIDPRLFVRCGYPLHIPDVQQKLEQEEAVQALVSQLIGMMTLQQPESREDRWIMKRTGKPTHEDKARREITFELARLKTICSGFGGETRSLYLSEPIEGLRNRVVRVMSRRLVKTGERCAPFSNYDQWSGEAEYDPGGLVNGQTHSILYYEDISNGEQFRPYKGPSGFVAIPREHVRLIELWGFRHKSGRYLCSNMINSELRKDPLFTSHWGGWPKEEAEQMQSECRPGKEWKMVLMQKGE